MAEFDRTVLHKLEELFEDGQVETLTYRADPGSAAQDTAIKVVHIPSGTEVVCNDFPSQIKNKSIALIGLVGLLGIQN